jgi:DNA-3-methyladenine glycosylase I
MTGPAVGPDGRPRCPWALSAPDYLSYHDQEWGRPVRDDTGMFERLCLEAFQSGLSWLTILRKRQNFRAAFRGFELATVARFGATDVARLLADTGIVRNRAKIEAAIANARAALALPDGLAATVWSYAEAPDRAPATPADVPAWTPASKALSAHLRRSGFRFTGPVTAYATMQACGVVNDHLAGCAIRAEAAVAVRAKPTLSQLGVDLAALDWRRSGTGPGSFEVAFVGGPARAEDPAGAGTAAPWVLLRVAGDASGRILVYDQVEWQSFVHGARLGEFDDAAEPGVSAS